MPETIRGGEAPREQTKVPRWLMPSLVALAGIFGGSARAEEATMVESSDNQAEAGNRQWVLKAEINELNDKTSKRTADIIRILNESDQKGVMTINNTKFTIRQKEFSTKKEGGAEEKVTITAGYNEKNDVVWITYSKNNGSYLVLDMKADGKPDVVTVNKQEGPANVKAAENFSNAFLAYSDQKSLATAFGIENSVKPQGPMYVFRFDQPEKGEPMIDVIFSDGKTEQIKGLDALKKVRDFWKDFSDFTTQFAGKGPQPSATPSPRTRKTA